MDHQQPLTSIPLKSEEKQKGHSAAEVPNESFDMMFTIQRTKSFWDEDAMDIDYDRDTVDATMAMLRDGSSPLTPQQNDCRDDIEDCASVSDTGSAAADKNGIRCTLSEAASSHDAQHERFYDYYLGGILESSPHESRAMMYMRSLLDDDTDAEDEDCFEGTHQGANDDDSSFCTKRNYSYDDLVNHQASPKMQEAASSLLSQSLSPAKMKYSRSLSDTFTIGIDKSQVMSAYPVQHQKQVVHRSKKEKVAEKPKSYSDNTDGEIDLYSSPTCVRKLSSREILVAQHQQLQQQRHEQHLRLTLTESTVTHDDTASQVSKFDWYNSNNSSTPVDRNSIHILEQDEMGTWV